MQVSIRIDDRDFQRWVRRLHRELPQTRETVARTLAAQGREYARDIVTIQIYATPQRGGYRRTRNLIRSIYGAVSSEKDATTIRIGAGANYSIYNEMGTYDNYIGGEPTDAANEILKAAAASNQAVIALEYGDVGSGLEPRPFIIPAIVMLQRDAPLLIQEAIRRLADNG